MTVRVIVNGDGRHPAVELAPGLYATRGHQSRDCGRAWRLLTGRGVWLYVGSFHVPFAGLRAAAVELAALPVPWACGDETALRGALVGDVRAAAVAVLSPLAGRQVCPHPLGGAR